MVATSLHTNELVIGYDLPLSQVPDLALTVGQPVRVDAPNGLGKTTLFRTLCGLRPPLAGSFVLKHQQLCFFSSGFGFAGRSNRSRNLNDLGGDRRLQPKRCLRSRIYNGTNFSTDPNTSTSEPGAKAASSTHKGVGNRSGRIVAR